MTDRLTDRLDARLRELTEAGCSVRAIFACPASVQRLFEEGGDGAVLMDCDASQDRAWYGSYELKVNGEAGVMLMHCRGEECWIRGLEEALDLTPAEAPAAAPEAWRDEQLRAAS